MNPFFSIAKRLWRPIAASSADDRLRKLLEGTRTQQALQQQRQQPQQPKQRPQAPRISVSQLGNYLGQQLQKQAVQQANRLRVAPDPNAELKRQIRERGIQEQLKIVQENRQYANPARVFRDVSTNVARGILRIPETGARSALQAGANIGAKLKGVPEPKGAFTSGEVTDPFRRFLYGKEPVTTYQRQGEEVSEGIFGGRVNPAFIAPVLAALDIYPGGGQPAQKLLRSALKTGEREVTERAVLKFAKQVGLEGNYARRLTDELTPLTKADKPVAREIVERILAEAGDRRLINKVTGQALKAQTGEEFIRNLDTPTKNAIRASARRIDNPLVKEAADSLVKKAPTSALDNLVKRTTPTPKINLDQVVKATDQPPLLNQLSPQAKAELDDIAKGLGMKNGDELVELARPKGASDIAESSDDLKMLNIKIKRVKDPVRKRELIAERKALLGEQRKATEGPTFAPVKSAQAEQAVAEALPKTILNKVEKGLPLTAQDAAKIDQVRIRVNQKFGVSPEQMEMGLGVEVPSTRVRLFEGAAQKTTPSGNVLDIARGSEALGVGTAGRLAEQAAKKPSLISRVVSTFPRMSAKKFRSLAANINSFSRTNPKLADDIVRAVFRPVEEFQAHAASLKRDWSGNLIQTKKAARLDKNDRLVLKKVLDGQDIATSARNPEGVQRLVDQMRQTYDNVLTELNRQELAAGVKLTPRRQDYFPHIRELLGEEKFIAAAKQADPDFVRRLGSGFRFSKARTGRGLDVKEDPFEVMDIYLEASQRRIGSLVPSRNINMIVDSLDQAKLLDRRGQQEMKGWLKSINDDLTGAGAGANPVERLQGRVAAGTVLANASSMLNNFIQPTLLAGFHPINSLKGLNNSLMSYYRSLAGGGLKEYLKVGGLESSYLRNAFDAVDLRRLQDKSILRKMGDTGARAFYLTDLLSKKQVIETAFAKQAAEGIPAKEALRLAEREAETLLPSRAPGTLATAFRETTFGRMAALFQTEVLAQTEAVAEAVRPRGIFSGKYGGIRGTSRGVANIAGIALAGHAFNSTFEQVFPGRRPAPDPIGWIQKALEDDETEGDSIVENSLEFLKQGAGQLPIIGNYFSEFGARSPFPAQEIVGDIVGSVKNVVEGDFGKEAILKAGRNVSALVGRGVKPLYRAGEGVYEFFSDSESKGFNTDKTVGEFFRSLLGGAYNTKAGQKFFEDIENKNKVIDAFDSQTIEDYKNIIGRGAEVDGEYTKYKSAVDQAVQFDRIFQNPKLLDMFNAVAEFDKAAGRPVDPVFDRGFYNKHKLDPALAQKIAARYLANKSSANERESKSMEIQNPWLEDLNDQRSKFFDRLAGKKKDIKTQYFGPEEQAPKATPDVQRKIKEYGAMTDGKLKFQYIQANPDLAEFYDQIGNWTRKKREYLGKPQFDPYPEPSATVQAKLDTYYALPENDGPKGGDKSRRLFLEANPDVIQHWIEKNIWTLQQEGSLSIYEGIDFAQDAMKAVESLGRNIVKLDNGSYVFTTNGDGAGFGSSGSTAKGGTSAGARTSVSDYFSKVDTPDTKVPVIKFKSPKINIPSAAPAPRIRIASLSLPNRAPKYDTTGRRGR